MKSGVRLRSGHTGVWVAAPLVFFLACGQPPQDVGGAAPLSSGKPAAGGAGLGPSGAARPELSLLGATELRVPLLVLPGDALVEVDGQPAYRRGGAIDLIGEVGALRHVRVRVWKGEKTLEEKRVTIQDGKLSPSIIDLNERPAPKPPQPGPKAPTRFGRKFGD